MPLDEPASTPSRPASAIASATAGLLEHALTHKSRAAEDPSGGVADNESLEFLGDAVLGFVVADVLYRDFPEYTEGPKSKAKAALVSTTALAGLSRALGLGDALLLAGEENGTKLTRGVGTPTAAISQQTRAATWRMSATFPMMASYSFDINLYEKGRAEARPSATS